MSENGKEILQTNEFVLPKECRQSFWKACKRGIYKELNRRKMITDVQLNFLLGKNE